MTFTRDDYLAFGRPDLTAAEIDAVARVMRSGWIGQGDETAAFEVELAEEVQAETVLTVNSCTSALFLCLLAAGVGPGDEVVVPSLTWCSTANAALYLGAKPIFADIDPDTFSVTAKTLSACMTPRTRAVVPVHMGGLALEIEEIAALCGPKITLVEDAAHALGACFAHGRPVGSSGNPTCFSFYANKNLSTAEGGAVATADDELAQAIRSLRLHALPADAWKRFINPKVHFNGGIETLGYKMNYTDLQSAIGRVQLQRFDEMQARRLHVARRYVDRLSGSGLGKFQAGIGEKAHAHHLILMRLDSERLKSAGHTRDSLLVELRDRKIGASLHYHPLHLMPLYRDPDSGGLPETERLAKTIITLPISASMTESDADYVSDHLFDLLAS